MAATIALLISLGLAVLGVLLMPLIYRFCDDEVLPWAEEWGPLISTVIALAGGIGTLVSVVVIAAGMP